MNRRNLIPFSVYFVVFYMVWIMRATVFYAAVDLSISGDTQKLIFSNAVKFILWVVPAAIYIAWLDKKNVLAVMRINTLIDTRGVKLASLITVVYFVIVFVTEYFLSHRTLLPLFHSALAKIAQVFLSVLISPFIEEFLFRGFVFSKLQEHPGFWQANLVQSFLFTAMHWPFWIWSAGIHGALLSQSMSTFALGVLLGWIAQRTNSIWPPIGVHILNNFLVAFLG